jgi:hypothetical protein
VAQSSGESFGAKAFEALTQREEAARKKAAEAKAAEKK